MLCEQDAGTGSSRVEKRREGKGSVGSVETRMDIYASKASILLYHLYKMYKTVKKESWMRWMREEMEKNIFVVRDKKKIECFFLLLK